MPLPTHQGKDKGDGFQALSRWDGRQPNAEMNVSILRRTYTLYSCRDNRSASRNRSVESANPPHLMSYPRRCMAKDEFLICFDMISRCRLRDSEPELWSVIRAALKLECTHWLGARGQLSHLTITSPECLNGFRSADFVYNVASEEELNFYIYRLGY